MILCAHQYSKCIKNVSKYEFFFFVLNNFNSQQEMVLVVRLIFLLQEAIKDQKIEVNEVERDLLGTENERQPPQKS